VFIRFVKLPPLGEENIEQIVTFEAQQHVPFPINEVVWDYQLLEGGEEKEVTLVAIKSDALDEINDAVNEAGVGTAEIDAAPMALYNAMRRAVADLSEPTLLIDIGAKTTNLLYVEGSKFFTRSVAVGGVSLTTAIEKEYGISFADAEAQKVTNGLVALGGGHTEQLDEAVAALAMTLRNALSRLPSEIARTTNYYRSQHGGSAPKRVLLAGGGANLPYLKEFFEEKMRLPVEFFNPLSAVAVAKGVDVDRLQREAHMMGELVGLGLRGVGKAAVNIDLVPATVEEERASERRRPYLIATAAALILGAAVFGFYKNSAAKKADGLVKEIEGQVENLVQFEAPLKKLNNEEQNLRNLADGYVGADRSHAYWVDLLGELKEGMASDALWVVDLEPLVGYDPLAKRDAKGRLKLSKVVRDEFQKAPFGTSSLLKISKPRVAQENGRPHRGRQAEPKLPEINAVLIRGLWRENADGAKVVNKALEKMRENAHSFRFVVTDPKSGEVELSDEQIITSNTTTSEHGEFALPFEMIIPLAKSVPFK
jgi:type IV pilus assembly protein PilM